MLLRFLLKKIQVPLISHFFKISETSESISGNFLNVVLEEDSKMERKLKLKYGWGYKPKP